MNWQECPTLDLALELRADMRASEIPESLAAPARALLRAVSAGIPPRYRFLADVARLRTAGRYQAELEGYAARFGVGWRDLLLGDPELLYWLTASDVVQTITAQHVIIRPAAGPTGTLRLFVPTRLLTAPTPG